MNTLFCHPFCKPEMLKQLEQCRIIEIVPGVWEYEGFIGTTFFLEPPSGNIFFLRDGDMLLMVDSGHHPFLKRKILEILSMFQREGVKELVLVMSHGHLDHGKNNDVIYQAGYEKVRFLLPENEFDTLNIPAHMIGSNYRAREYYDPCIPFHDSYPKLLEWFSKFPEYSDPLYQNTWTIIRNLPEVYDSDRLFEAYRYITQNILCGDISTYCADRAEPLRLKDRVTRIYGDTIVRGWPLGRFFLIHDASQSPGHISIYDPLNKLMLSGDATGELNPTFIDTDFGNCLQICRQYLQMAEAGFIELAGDAHRSSIWWDNIIKTTGIEPALPLALIDLAQGQRQCADFYRMWLNYYSALWDGVIRTHAAIGEATVSEIIDEMRKSTDRYIKFKLDLGVPKFFSNTDMLVAKILMESGASKRVDGDRILFSPPDINRLKSSTIPH